jgi:WD40 repeat protein
MLGHKNGIFSICKIDEKTIASSSCDKTIRLWNVEEKKCIHIFTGHSCYVWCVIYLKDESQLASCSSDKTIKIWDIVEKKCINTIKAHNREITVLTLLSDNQIASASMDAKIKIWEC